MVVNVDPEPVWDKPPEVDEKLITFVDDNVRAKFPPGTQVHSITPYGSSYWTRTAEIQTTQPDGSDLSYFLKVSHKETGRAMVSGEFESMSRLHEAVPHLTPKPVGWGTYASQDNIYFFLCGFVDMLEDLPDENLLGKGLADLHTKAISPNGKYGFPLPTLQGTVPQFVEWTDTWEEFFTKSIKLVMDNEEKSQGADPEVQELCQLVLSKVVPRLLRPMETGGRSIQPRLVHGDIWDGNVSTSTETGTPLIFDATCIYGHNEIELAPLRPVRHQMGKSYVNAYFKHFAASEPTEDQDDRNALYCLRWNMNCSTLYPGNLRFRKLCVDTMKRLTAKHAEGYQGWAAAHGEEVVHRPWDAEWASLQAPIRTPYTTDETDDPVDVTTYQVRSPELSVA